MRETTHLARRGIDPDTPSSPDGSEDFLTVWLTDPDGYRIELVRWPAGHPEGMTPTDSRPPGAATHDAVSGRSAREVLEELLRRRQAGGDPDLDDLVAADMVNHAAGP